MSRWRARLAVLAVFLAGMICGAAALHIYSLRVESRILHARDVVAEMIVYQLDRQLDLNEAQRHEIYQAVIETREELFGIRRELLPQLRAIFDRAYVRIRKTLTPEQQVIYDKIIAERRRLLEELEKKQQSR
ncbi:MAG: hypothetical protein AB1714_12615 [Acidobacteriota bacterium]